MTTPTLTDSERILRAGRKARNATTLGQLERLVCERIRWERKATLARNKLSDINDRIARRGMAMAREQFDAELGQGGAK